LGLGTATNVAAVLVGGGIGTLAGAKLPAHLENAREDILAFTAFAQEIWRQIWSNNPNERLDKEIRRATSGSTSSPETGRSAPRPRR